MSAPRSPFAGRRPDQRAGVMMISGGKLRRVVIISGATVAGALATLYWIGVSAPPPPTRAFTGGVASARGYGASGADVALDRNRSCAARGRTANG